MSLAIKNLANLIKDYWYFEEHDISDVHSHIRSWLLQFKRGNRLLILNELTNILQTTYFSKEKIVRRITNAIKNKKLIGLENPHDFWSSTTLLNVQKTGNSQKDLLNLLRPILKQKLSLDIKKCGSKKRFCYIDDGIFSGNRIITDLQTWLEEHKPAKSIDLIIFVLASHSLGEYFISRFIKNFNELNNYKIKLKIVSTMHFQNTLYMKDNSDVLWPKVIPEEKLAMQAYNSLDTTKVSLRSGSSTGSLQLFSSPLNRRILETELLIASSKIMHNAKLLKKAHKPLGYTQFQSLGFGATFVTYRNCPNNCPLAFWVKTSKWKPLFLRKINK